MKNTLYAPLAALVAGSLALGLGACASSPSSNSPSSNTSTSGAASAQSLDTKAFDELIASIEPADEQTIAASQWASKVKSTGKLKVGGTKTSYLFSQLDEADGSIRGFDAGLSEMLARYITGDEANYEVTQVDSSTRESVLQSGQVDAVFATYSITDDRKKVISFAGPYYTSQQGILVSARNSDIKGVDDLAGKTVATQSGSTGPQILEEFAPEAEVQEFDNDTEARTALEQGRVDAYVTDYTLLLNALAKNVDTYAIAGEPFGPKDNYGIGLPLDSDGVEFVNDFLRKVIDDGKWNTLWKLTLGDRTGVSEVPASPTIG